MHEELINLLSCSDPWSGREWYVRMYVCGKATPSLVTFDIIINLKTAYCYTKQR